MVNKDCVLPMAAKSYENFIFSADARDKPPDGVGGSFPFSMPQKTSFRDMVLGK